MCVDDHKCNAWISLDSVGVSAQGCLRSSQWIRDLSLPCLQSATHSSIYIDDPSVSLTCIKNVYHGSFGSIDLALYRTSEGVKEVYVKRPLIPGKSLLYEACVKILVGNVLKEIGFPTGAPHVLRVFRLRDDSIGFVMEQIEGAVTLNAYLESTDPSCFSYVIIDCLFQLSAMMWYLENMIGLNHRDLTPGNFLVVEHEPRQKIISVGTEVFPIISTHTLTLIDFGFSCIGSVETQQSELSLSTVYPITDPCPKNGRDLYLFIGFIYIDYYDHLPITLRTLFESWLQEAGTKLCKFIMRMNDKTKQWLYFTTGNDKIKRFHSTSEQIVTDLQRLGTTH